MIMKKIVEGRSRKSFTEVLQQMRGKLNKHKQNKPDLWSHSFIIWFSDEKTELIISLPTTYMLIPSKLQYLFSLSANFAVLGLTKSCKIDEVKKKYYELAKLYHPDVNSGDQNSHKKFAEITKVPFI